MDAIFSALAKPFQIAQVSASIRECDACVQENCAMDNEDFQHQFKVKTGASDKGLGLLRLTWIVSRKKSCNKRELPKSDHEKIGR